ncbi:MAG TPA: Brp/Blh family beta-carotene 15,15'-dioxygenase [Segetibacter sp.]
MKGIHNKYKLVSITVLLAIGMVAWQAFAGALPYKFQILFFAAAIFTFGIPHGALDEVVEQEVARRKQSSFQKIAFSFRYMGAITVYALCWYLFPQISLLAFLLMSSWHFGETDFQQTQKITTLGAFVTLFYGTSILLWIIFTHADEAGVTLMQLVPPASVFHTYWLNGISHKHIILTGSAFTIIAGLLFNQFTKKSQFSLQLILQLIVILTCCYFLPLLPAFALYFAGWHSIITLYNIRNFINTAIDARHPASFKSLCLKAMPASLIAISGLVLTGFLLNHYAPVFNPLPLLFVFLSLITLPHIQVMHKLNLHL